MVIALIIVSIIAAVTVSIDIIAIILYKQTIKHIKEIEDLEEEYLFTVGEIEIPEEKIAYKFPDATIVCHLERNNILDKDETWKIVDVSNYAKNHVIGLTYFVQTQLFDEIKAEAASSDYRLELLNNMIQESGFDKDEIDIGFLNEVIDSSITEIYNINDELGTMTGPPIPHCTVYQLKDGRWLWQPKYY